MKNNKGFSLVELLGVIVILGILMAAAMVAYTKYIDYSKKKSYRILRDSAISATENYMMDHPNVIDTTTGVTFETLVDEEYLESATDPSEKSSQCKGEVRLSGSSTDTKKLQVNYFKVTICCHNYYYT